MSDKKYLDALEQDLKEQLAMADFATLSNYVKKKIIESYRNGIARGKREAEKKPEGPVQK
jgi:hypothetical protein